MSRPAQPIANYSGALNENPEIGTSFKPEPPFEDYTRGTVSYCEPSGRRLAMLRTPAIDNNGTEVFPITMYVSRYFGEILHWKEYGCRIPKGMESDHINNNKTDDRYANIQNITQNQNTLKGFAVGGYHAVIYTCAYCGEFATKHQYHATQHQLNTTSYPMCCSMTCASRLRRGTVLEGEVRDWVRRHQILYTIRTHWFDYEDYFHDYYPYTELLDIGRREMVGYRGIDTLRQFLPRKLQQLDPMQLRTPRELSQLIQEWLREEKPVEVIAGFLGYDSASIHDIIRRYKLIVPWRERRVQYTTDVMSLHATGLSIRKIAREVDMSHNTVWGIINRSRQNDRSM